MDFDRLASLTLTIPESEYAITFTRGHNFIEGGLISTPIYMMVTSGREVLRHEKISEKRLIEIYERHLRVCQV